MFLQHYTEGGPAEVPDGLEENLQALLRAYTRQPFHIRFLSQVARDRGIPLRRPASPNHLLKEHAETFTAPELDALDYFTRNDTGEVLDLLLLLQSLTRPQLESMSAAAKLGVVMRSCGDRPWSRARFYLPDDYLPAPRSNSKVVDAMDGVVRLGLTAYGLVATFALTIVWLLTGNGGLAVGTVVAAFVGWFALQASNEYRVKQDQLDSETGHYVSTLMEPYTAMVVADIDLLKHRARAAADRLVTTLQQDELSKLDSLTSDYLHRHISSLFHVDEVERTGDILSRASVDSPDIEELRDVHEGHLQALVRDHQGIREALAEAVKIVEALEAEAADDAAQLEAVRYLRERRSGN